MSKSESEIPLGSKISTPIGGGGQRGLAIVDLVLRVLAAMATLSSAIVMGTANQTLPFSTQSSQFKASYKDLPMFMWSIELITFWFLKVLLITRSTYHGQYRDNYVFFLLANCIVCGYLFLSLPLSIFQMVEVASITPRLILLILDTMAMALAAAGASVAASIVYLAYQGNVAANWVSFCSQFDSFCRHISGSLIGSFAAVLALMLLIALSAIAMSRPILNTQPYKQETATQLCT